MTIALRTLIDLFAATKQMEGRSPRTIDWYRERLDYFVRSVGNGQELRLPDFTLNKVRAFIGGLQARESRFVNHPNHPEQKGKLSSYYIHGYVRALKAFSSWLVEEECTPRDVLAKLKRPKLEEPMIRIPSDEEIDAILLAVNPNCFLGGRMHAMVLVLLDTRVRASELCGLTVENTFVSQNHLRVLGKGRKERIVPFGSTTKKALLRYLTTWRPQPVDETIDNLFLSIDSRPLSYTALRQGIKRLGRKVGVDRLHSHLFRHTFAVKYLINGGDVMSLRQMLGHTTLEVTEMYIHLAEAHVQIQHHRYSPVDRLQIRTRKR